MPKHANDGVKKRCRCGKRKWAKCKHPWHFSFYWRGREHRYSLDQVARARNQPAPRSRTEAATWRDLLRNEIRNNTFAKQPVDPVPEGRLTFGDVCDQYLTKHVQKDGRREGGKELMEFYVAALRRSQVPAANGATIKLERKTLDEITTSDVEAVRDGWKRKRTVRAGRVGADRALKRLRHLFNWAIERGYVDRTPFKRHGVTVVHFGKDLGRTRRLEPGEEARLLEHASPHLHALITAALETGMRRGELLALRWRDIRWEAEALLLPAEITKTSEARDVPMTRRLRAVLDLRKHAPDGSEHGPDAFVFGNEVGEKIPDIRDAWVDTCKAAEITGLHFHDLRREFASRLRETPGISDHHVRDWLGHADMATTSRYLATTRVGLQHARRAFELHREGFAHDSHTAPESATDTSSVTPQKPQLSH
jgi:integrase